MFEQMKTMGALAGLLKNKERLKQISDEFRETIEKLRVTGVAGGSAVRVTVNGRFHVIEVYISPVAVTGAAAEGDAGKAQLEALILEATNDAVTRAQALVGEEARAMAKDLGVEDLPGVDKLLGSV